MIKRLVKYQLTVLLFTVLSIHSNAIANDNSSQTEKFNINEKVVLVADRDLYLSGEKILFTAKVIVEDGSTQSDLSKILYVELFKEKSAIVQAKFKIEKGLVQGYLQLPTELLSGNYYLRAYTMLMRNGKPENFFNTLIRIVNPERKLEESSIEQLRPYVIEPEGGKFVSGIEANTVVFFNKLTLGSIKNAIIVNSTSDTLSEVFIYDNGIGLFSFTPNIEHDYWLKMLLIGGDSIFIKLNETQNSGIVLRFDQQKAEVKIFSQGEAKGLKLKLDSYNSEFEEINSKEIILSDSIVSTYLNNVAFTKGVNYLVLKKENEEVVSINPIFVKSEKGLSFDLELRSEFGKREKVEIGISGLKENDLVVSSVAKKGTFTSINNDLPLEFVFNPLLLNDNCEKLTPLNEDVIKQIELSFIFNQSVFNSIEFKEKFTDVEVDQQWLPEIRDLSVSGLIRNEATKEPLVNQRIFASVIGSQPQIHSYLSDENGNFIFSLNQLEGTKDVGLTMDTIKDIDAEIIVFSDFSKRFPLFRNFPLQIDTSHKKLIEEMYINQQVEFKFKEVVLNQTNFIDTIPFPFQDVQASIVLEDYIDLPTMQEIFNEIVTYVSARKRGGKFVLNVLNDATEVLYDKPLVLIDNLPVFDIDRVMRIKTAKVEKIEVITKPYSFGEMSFNGIIMITTKTDNFGGVKLPNETVFFKYSTSSLSSKQVFPEFDGENTISSNQPYFSNTIYWNSENELNETGIEQSFYTSDETGMFDVMLNIITANGDLLQRVKSIKVD